MKMATVWQPYAGLLIAGVKRFESRSWPISYRGDIGIHSALKKDAPISPELEQYFKDHPWLVPICSVYGAILGTVRLTDCLHVKGVYQLRIDSAKPTPAIETLDGRIIKITDHKEIMGDFTQGRYAWDMKYPEKFNEPIYCKGAQGIWNYGEAR